METAVLLLQCPDRKGIVAKISDWIWRHDGNIIQLDQHSTDPFHGWYFMRLEFCFDETVLSPSQLEAEFSDVGIDLGAQWNFHYLKEMTRVGILVSQHDHCLYELLYRYQSQDLKINLPCIVSNHRICAPLAEQFHIPFHFVPIIRENREEKEKEILKLVKETTDLLVLARYMQILTPSFISEYGKDIINIHHSFLPSFSGANPYQKAFDRGVKLIGATAHYVTENLDEGPIIGQRVEGISHRDSIEDLKRKGKFLEKNVLVEAISLHIQHKVMRHENKTIIFE